MNQSLTVYFERRVVGTVDLADELPGFSYAAEWLTTRGAFPISTRMPLSAGRYGPQVFLPWAANLLPESEHLRALGNFLGMASSDVVGLLSRIGRDTAGALSIGSPGGTSSKKWRLVEDEASLERIIQELPSKPFLVGEDGVSMSLAGVQAKLGVAADGQGRIYIPTDGSPSTHILKPDSETLWGSVQNEAFCMSLARRVGLQVPDLTTGIAGARSYLLVARYDRIEVDGRWRRLHQEDFCQALGKPPSAKYERNMTGPKGPTLKDMFDVARAKARPADLARLLDMVIVNVACCNTDAHAKNYSMIIRGDGASLAPLYDVMCAEVWPSVTRNLAQRIGDKDRGGHIMGRHWQRMAKACGLNPVQTLARVRTIAEGVGRMAALAEADVEAMPAGTHPLLKLAREAVETRARAMLSGLAHVEDANDHVDDVEGIRAAAPGR